MPLEERKTTYQIAHDSGDMLNDLIALVEFMDGEIPGHKITFESCKSDFGLVVVETESEV